jgi:hypothetical protein
MNTGPGSREIHCELLSEANAQFGHSPAKVLPAQRRRYYKLSGAITVR